MVVTKCCTVKEKIFWISCPLSSSNQLHHHDYHPTEPSGGRSQQSFSNVANLVATGHVCGRFGNHIVNIVCTEFVAKYIEI